MMNEKERKITVKEYFSKLEPEGKQRLYSFMQGYGISQSTTYLRFSQKSFSEWEMDGVERCIRAFSPQYDGDLKEFWFALESNKSKKEFKDYMISKGMSYATVVNRFQQFNFKPFEIQGVYALLELFKEKCYETV